jgi:GNAT superfamily N-acetyltransferase
MKSSVAQERTRIRMASREDADGVARVINAAFVVERVAFDGDRTNPDGVRRLMDKGAFLVVEEGNATSAGGGDRTDFIGCVYVERREDRCYLGLLSVAPGLQGKGLGRRLVDAAEEYSRNAGCHTMDLRIISPRAEDLLPFYKHLGYLEAGTAPFVSDVHAKVPCHYLLMTKPLG